MKDRGLVMVFSLLLFLPTVGWAGTSIEGGIQIKEVVTDVFCEDMKEYDCGSDIYPDYCMDGLPPTFGIKKETSIFIPAEKIKNIKVVGIVGEGWDAWHIEITLSDDFGSRMEEFTANRRGKRVALVIEKKVLTVVSILDKIGSQLHITSMKDRIETMSELLKVVHPVITREIIAASSNMPVHQDAAAPRR